MSLDSDPTTKQARINFLNQRISSRKITDEEQSEFLELIREGYLPQIESTPDDDDEIKLVEYGTGKGFDVTTLLGDIDLEG